jgi:hydrophobe/amphiphile efflux-3 (HAE3) family protein
VKRFMFRLVEFSQRHARLIIGVTALITVALGYFALGIQADPDTANLIPQDARVMELTRKYGSGAAESNFLIIMAEAADIFTIEKLGLLESAYRRIEQVPTVSPGVTPFNFIAFRKEDKRLAFSTLSQGKGAPATEEALTAFKSAALADPIARNMVVSADGSSLSAYFPVSLQNEYEKVFRSVEGIIQPLKAEMDIRITGGLLYNRAVLAHLYNDLPVFLGLSLIIILVSYYLSFRTKRSLALPVIVVVLGTVWTVGVMALLGFKLTIVQIMTPPLVLILGSAYSIHMLNQYYREARVSGENKHWIVDSVAHINTTIFLASATTVFGFASLLTSSLRQLREFGVATSVGIAFSALLALIFLPAALSLLKPPTAVQRSRVLEGFISRRMGGLSRLIVRRRFLVIGAAVLIAAAFLFSLRAVRYETDFTRYFRPTEKVVVDNARFMEKFGGFVTVNYSLSAPADAPNYFTDPEVLKAISRFEERLSADKDIPYISSFVSFLKAMNGVMTGASEVPNARPLILLLSRAFSALSSTPIGRSVTGILMNRDFSRYTLVARIYNSEQKNMAFEDRLKDILARMDLAAKQTLPPEVTGEFWGPTISVLHLSDVLTRNQVSSILSSAVLVFLISALVFRSLKLGLLVLAPLVSGIMVSFVVMGIFSIPLDVVTVTFASIAIGIGVDNAIHLTIQYRRQRTIYPSDPEKTIEHTLKIGGRPMILTTLSIIASLMVFIFSSFRPIMYFGILISLTLFMTTAGALVLLPVLLFMDAKKRAKLGKDAPAAPQE